MKKLLLVLTVLLLSYSAKSQVLGGTVVTSGRTMTTASDFKIVGNVEGHVVLELAVNRQGKVTSVRVIYDESNVKSTPQIMKSQNAAKKLAFTAGTRYAEFEHVRVKYTYKKA